MIKKMMAAAGLSGCIGLAACASSPQPPVSTEPAMTDEQKALAANPLMQVSPLPYHYPPFDLIRNEHFLPAFEAGMKQGSAEIDAIAGNPEPATFANTIVALEKSGQTLTRVSQVFFNLTGTNTNDALNKLEADISPRLSAYNDSIVLNGKLFARVKTLHDNAARLGLDDESLRLLERYHTNFVRAGAQLSEADKKTLQQYNEELARLTTQFQQNLLKETNDSAVVVDSEAELDGLDAGAIAGARDAAKAKGLEGKYLIALMNTTGQPPLAQLRNRALRERIYKASIERASRGNDADNKPVVARLVELRARRAQLLGYASHAAYQLEDSTARTTDAVNTMLARIAPAAVANARREAAELQKLIDQQKGGFKLAAWDWAYYAEQLRKQRYAFDESQTRPYFELDNVLQNGVFYAATQLYGITFKERTDLPRYHPDIRTFEVFRADGAPLAIFIFDPFKRESKQGGAWMNSYVDQSVLMGWKPVVANHLNVPKPPAGEPVLLTASEVNTAFHEFGHALHGMFSSVEYPLFSGTSVPRDFVEYPSQVNEMWATWPEVLAHYARHYQTGEPMPKALVDKIKATEKFNQGFATTEYLAATLLDQAWHQLPAEHAQVADVAAFEQQALKAAGVDYAPVPPRYRTTYFSHVFSGGYSAGYYSYIWSEVLVADSVDWFKENGGLKRSSGDRFRSMLLSRGGSEDAMTMYRDFAGRDPQIAPLLKRRGLEAQPAKAGKPAAAKR